jgi:hypothetical protein
MAYLQSAVSEPPHPCVLEQHRLQLSDPRKSGVELQWSRFDFQPLACESQDCHEDRLVKSCPMSHGYSVPKVMMADA